MASLLLLFRLLPDAGRTLWREPGLDAQSLDDIKIPQTCKEDRIFSKMAKKKVLNVTYQSYQLWCLIREEALLFKLKADCLRWGQCKQRKRWGRDSSLDIRILFEICLVKLLNPSVLSGVLLISFCVSFETVSRVSRGEVPQNPGPRPWATLVEFLAEWMRLSASDVETFGQSASSNVGWWNFDQQLHCCSNPCCGCMQLGTFWCPDWFEWRCRAVRTLPTGAFSSAFCEFSIKSDLLPASWMGRALFCPLSPPKITLDSLRCSGTSLETSEGSDFTDHHGATSSFAPCLGCLRWRGSVGTDGVGAAAVGKPRFPGGARRWALADPWSHGSWAPGPPCGACCKGGSAGAVFFLSNALSELVKLLKPWVCQDTRRVCATLKWYHDIT